MDRIVVSAIVTTYKREPQIVCRAVKSILEQTYKNLEIIVVDDSPEDYEFRRETCKAVKELSNEIVYVKNEKNIGACASRNIGIKLSTGQYIAFLDDDDEWLPLKIEKQLKKMNEEIGLVYCGCIRHDDEKNIDTPISFEYKSGMLYSKLLYGNFIGGVSFPLLRRTAVLEAGGFDETFDSLQDTDMWVRIAKQYKIDCVEEPLVVYHVGGKEQISTNPKKKLNGLLQFNLKYADELNNNHDLKWNRTKILPVYYARCGQLKSALCIWLKCSIERPWMLSDNLKSIYSVLKSCGGGGIKRIKSFAVNSFYRFTTIISPALNTKLRYRQIMGKRINLKQPTTFNEKICWLKLNVYMKHPLIIQCADKYAVREYVKKIGCSELLTELYAVYDDPNQICWDILPIQFAMKWNYGSYMNIICENKEHLNEKLTIEQLKNWRKNKYWLSSSELQYKYSPKKIIVEEYLGKENGALPEDYKFFCFNGKALYVMVCTGRTRSTHAKYCYFDRDWTFCDFDVDSTEQDAIFITKPKLISEAFEYADKLAKDFPFVRVDLYIFDDRIVFGELTFTPGAGMDAALSQAGDTCFGELINIECAKEFLEKK